MRYARSEARRAGFSLIELVIVLVLSSTVVIALHQGLMAQRRFYRQERAITADHDALRLAASVLAADLREANGALDDIAVAEAESIVDRSPVGFGIVCAVDTDAEALALIDVGGRLAGSGDSLLVYTPDGWLVRSAVAKNPSDAASLDCAYVDGPSAELRLSVEGPVADVPVGAPVRAFHRYTYQLEQDGSHWWLARDDGETVDILSGPFAGDSAGLAFEYVDSLGQSTSNPADVGRVDLSLVAIAREDPDRRDSLRISVTPRNR